MLYFVKNNQLIQEISEMKRLGKTIGLVPTMGALHDGHLSLVEAARANDVVIVSLFVNPLQFNNPHDLENYPSDLEEDMNKLKGVCDILYAPTMDELYPMKTKMKFDFGDMEHTLEGKYRPGHFNGVGIVVSKLLNIIRPDKAYFGLKDLQQITIVRTLVRDLSIQTEIVGCPIVRENSGLAMSSRNRRLSATGIETARCIYAGLKIAKSVFDQLNSVKEAIRSVKDYYDQVKGLETEYCEAVNEYFEVLEETPQAGSISLCVAGYVEGVRLIDNLYLRSE